MNSYIVINTPKDGENREPVLMLKAIVGVLKIVIPPGSPDFDHLYHRVVVWHVELDSTGEPLREVGLDDQGKILAIAPWRENYGVITDCNGVFNPAEHEQLSAEQFEKEWSSFTFPSDRG